MILEVVIVDAKDPSHQVTFTRSPLQINLEREVKTKFKGKQ